MNVTLASFLSIDDKNAFSGIPHYMAQALKASSDNFTFIKIPSIDDKVIRRNDINNDEKKFELIKAGNFLSEKLKKMSTDVVICIGSAMIPYLETDKPIVLWHDSTWFSLEQMDFEQFLIEYPLLAELDQLALDKSTLVVCASDWLREQTLACYKISPEKMYVIPFGANLDFTLAEKEAEYIVERNPGICTLTFVGIEWIRKGLPLAVDLKNRLNAAGLKTFLNVIGCEIRPPSFRNRLSHFIHNRSYSELEQFSINYPKEKNINRVGFLDKENPVEYQRYVDILRNSHFLIHPTSFECYGLVLAEANAYGVPALATNRYGPKTIIRNGVNGYLFNLDEFVEHATTLIQELFQDYDTYQKLAKSSYCEYQERLNWTVGVRKLNELMTHRIFSQ